MGQNPVSLILPAQQLLLDVCGAGEGKTEGLGTLLAWRPLSPHDSRPATIPSWLLASLQWSPLSPAIPHVPLVPCPST